MASHELTPAKLKRLLASLVIAEALVVDAIRGRSIRKADVATLRDTVTSIHQVLRALDKTRPWSPPPIFSEGGLDERLDWLTLEADGTVS